MKKAVLTVLGHDRVGIMAKVCTFLADHDINILDIDQSIISGYFNMVMVVDLAGANAPLGETVEGLYAVGEALGVQIKLQREEIFNAMHRI